MKKIKINNQITVGQNEKLLFILGPCQIESLEHCRKLATDIKKITDKYSKDINVVFKSSFDKANRTKLDSKRGVGFKKGLEILSIIKEESGLPIITDIHTEDQILEIAKVADIIQIPAFLCRQTDLLVAAGKSGKIINLKKGQFLHPEDLKHSAAKVSSTGNENILLCERGSMFGYRQLIVDFRSFSMLKEIGYPVIYDVTHSVQSMGSNNGTTGGCSEYIPQLTNAALAYGVDGIFLEVHDDPKNAPSDGANMLNINNLENLILNSIKIRNLNLQ